MHACIHTCILSHTHARAHTHTHIFTYYAYMRTHTHMYETHIRCSKWKAEALTSLWPYVYGKSSVGTFVCKHACLCIWSCIRMFLYTYVHFIPANQRVSSTLKYARTSYARMWFERLSPEAFVFIKRLYMTVRLSSSRAVCVWVGQARKKTEPISRSNKAFGKISNEIQTSVNGKSAWLCFFPGQLKHKQFARTCCTHTYT